MVLRLIIYLEGRVSTTYGPYWFFFLEVIKFDNCKTLTNISPVFGWKIWQCCVVYQLFTDSTPHFLDSSDRLGFLSFLSKKWDQTDLEWLGWSSTICLYSLNSVKLGYSILYRPNRENKIKKVRMTICTVKKNRVKMEFYWILYVAFVSWFRLL